MILSLLICTTLYKHLSANHKRFLNLNHWSLIENKKKCLYVKPGKQLNEECYVDKSFLYAKIQYFSILKVMNLFFNKKLYIKKQLAWKNIYLSISGVMCYFDYYRPS